MRGGRIEDGWMVTSANQTHFSTDSCWFLTPTRVAYEDKRILRNFIELVHALMKIINLMQFHSIGSMLK